MSNRSTLKEGPRRILRKEVNFGCPVDGCGNPFLEYHHFDPPWREGKRHHLPGMIALCSLHHPRGDIGTWTNDQLREMKKNPYLRGGKVRGRSHWLRRDVIIEGGGLVAINPGALLSIRGKRAIWLRRDKRGSHLNIDIRDVRGNQILKMVDNDWVVSGDLLDLHCPPGGRSMTIDAPSRRFKLTLTFHSCSPEDAHERLTTWVAETRKYQARQAKKFPELAEFSDEPTNTPAERASMHMDESFSNVQMPCLWVDFNGHITRNDGAVIEFAKGECRFVKGGAGGAALMSGIVATGTKTIIDIG